jgi:hypothetical protein
MSIDFEKYLIFFFLCVCVSVSNNNVLHISRRDNIRSQYIDKTSCLTVVRFIVGPDKLNYSFQLTYFDIFYDICFLAISNVADICDAAEGLGNSSYPSYISSYLLLLSLSD